MLAANDQDGLLVDRSFLRYSGLDVGDAVRVSIRLVEQDYVIVGETNDSRLNDIRRVAVTPDHVLAAIAAAQDGEVAEGSVGAGTGTVAFGWKGGIGTSSRQLPAALDGYTVGVLVQANAALGGPTNLLQADPYVRHNDALPFTLQDHDHPVRFRNFWVRPLPDLPTDERGPREARPALAVPTAVLERYVGTYGTATEKVAVVTRRGGRLFILSLLHLSEPTRPY